MYEGNTFWYVLGTIVFIGFLVWLMPRSCDDMPVEPSRNYLRQFIREEVRPECLYAYPDGGR